MKENIILAIVADMQRDLDCRQMARLKAVLFKELQDVEITEKLESKGTQNYLIVSCLPRRLKDAQTRLWHTIGIPSRRCCWRWLLRCATYLHRTSDNTCHHIRRKTVAVK